MALKRDGRFDRKQIYAGPYSQSAPKVTKQPGDRGARRFDSNPVRDPLLDRETSAGSFSGKGMSAPLPKPRSHMSALGMSRPAPPRSGGKRYT